MTVPELFGKGDCITGIGQSRVFSHGLLLCRGSCYSERPYLSGILAPVTPLLSLWGRLALSFGISDALKRKCGDNPYAHGHTTNLHNENLAASDVEWVRGHYPTLKPNLFIKI